MLSADKEDVGKITAVYFWDKEQVVPLLTSLKLAPGTAEYHQLSNTTKTLHSDDHNPSGLPLYQPSLPSPEKILRCSHCKITFSSRDEQVAHYGQEWHLFNMKRSLEGLKLVSEENFLHGACKNSRDGVPGDADGGSSEEDIDGESSDEDELQIRKQPRIFFVNSDEQVISIYRSVLLEKKAVPSSETELIHRVTAAVRKLCWVIILIGGGHFSGAVFKGSEHVIRKTFHSYTVRAKQGGTQSFRDNRSATSHPRSAGASLRRYNEQSHLQHIQELLASWTSYFAECDLIFYRCPKSYSHILFGGQQPVLSRCDHRLRTIPFSTKRATYAEVKRVHKTLSQIFIHGKLEDLIESQKKDEKNSRTIPSSEASICKEKPSKLVTKLSMDEKASLDTGNMGVSSSSSSETESDLDCLVEETLCLNMNELNPFGSSVEDARTDWKGKKKRIKERIRLRDNEDMPAILKANESKDSSFETRKIANAVYTACRTGDLHRLKAIHEFSRTKDITYVSDVLSSEEVEALLTASDNSEILCTKFGINEKTLLHIAAENCRKDVLWWLLEQGCDPSVPNKRNETPYVTTKNKDVKNHFRRYVASYPDQYDYEKAGIPGPLTKEMEAQAKAKLSEKKKLQKKVKQEREKRLKQEMAKKQKEEEEKQKFLQLSDREKRALAAEKRMQLQMSDKSNQGNVSSTVLLRCFQCAKDITGMVPFEYYDFKFCSTSCVGKHRSKVTPS